MIVGDLFQQLSYGHLGDLSLGSDGSGSIPLDRQNKVLSHTNSALTSIFTRFYHKSRFVQIWLDAETKDYRLAPAHSISQRGGNRRTPRYILDSTDDPFRDRIIKILSATADITEDMPSPSAGPFTETLGQRGRTLEPYGHIELRGHDTIHVPRPVQDGTVTVEYQPDHPRLSIPVDVNEEINIPPVLENVLELKVAALVYGAMNGEGHMVKAQNLAVQYETACQEIERMDLLNLAGGEEHDRLRSKGFV